MNILIVDDNESLARGLVVYLKGERHDARIAGTVRDALHLAESKAFDLVITDLRLPDGTGLEVIKACRQAEDPPEVILMTAYSSVETAVEAMKLGALDYLTKPVPLEEFAFRIQRVLQIRSVSKTATVLKRSQQDLLSAAGFADPLADLVGDSPLLCRAKDLIQKSAPFPSTVLITGETGTGKELAARALHALSPRASEPFIRVNCASIPETLFESELFGHERGAFTDARERRLGRFELAHQGTLFLDEVGEVPLHLQAKLLRVLQDKEINRLGGTETISVDVRIIAATNRDLQQLAAQGRFREDLLYRLSVIQISMPPLRERQQDIPLLARHLLKHLSSDLGRPCPTLDPQSEQELVRHHWPGNVRELRNALERALVLSDGHTLPAFLPFFTSASSNNTTQSTSASTATLPADGLVHGLEHIEREWIRQALLICDGNKSKTAELLRLSRPNLAFRLKKLGLDEK